MKSTRYELLINSKGDRRVVDFIQVKDESRVTAVIEGRTVQADAVRISPGVYSVLLDGRSIEVTVEQAGRILLARSAGHEFQIEIVDPRSKYGKRGGGIELEGRQSVIAPMPGKIVSVLVAQGQAIEASQGLLVIEAMKMQNEIRSPKSGSVEQLLVKEGQTVSAGEVLVVLT